MAPSLFSPRALNTSSLPLFGEERHGVTAAHTQLAEAGGVGVGQLVAAAEPVVDVVLDQEVGVGDRLGLASQAATQQPVVHRIEVEPGHALRTRVEHVSLRISGPGRRIPQPHVRQAEFSCTSSSPPSSRASARSFGSTTAACSRPSCAGPWTSSGTSWVAGLPRGHGAHGQGRLARAGLARRVRRPGARPPGPVHLLGRDVPGARAAAGDHREYGGPHADAAGAATRRRRSCCRRSATASCWSGSAIRSPRPGPTWPRCRPAPCATATSGSSTARRSSPPTPRIRSTSGSRRAPTRMRPSTRASRSSWCPPTCRASRARRSAPSAVR